MVNENENVESALTALDGIVVPENALPPQQLADLPELLRDAVARGGWSELMPVQSQAIPYMLAQRDLMVQSRTGSGKTGAFVLPAIACADVNVPATQVMILVPTRELARQVHAEAEKLAGPDGPRTVAVYGGVGYEPQVDAFRKGAHIVAGTPGRILDHLMRRTLTLDKLKLIVFDEADRMLSMGFYPDMVRVKSYLPKNAEIHGCMFSATFPPRVLSLAGQFLSKPEILSLSHDHIHVTDVEHVFYEVPPQFKERTLIRIIEVENPGASIIFCNTRARVRFVARVLQRFGYDADALSSDLGQGARERVLRRVREGKLRFLVATDVAARGIDIPELTHIIQYEPPEEAELYIHRAGRTGRAGAGGTAISLVNMAEKHTLDLIAQQFKMDMEERIMPTDENVEDIVSERLIALLETRLRDRDNLQVERMQRFLPLARALAECDDELNLVAMLLDDYYQESLHGTPGDHEPPPVNSSPSRGDKGQGKDRRRRRTPRKRD
jgi:ATP-dependent RNA helicase DeaD